MSPLDSREGSVSPYLKLAWPCGDAAYGRGRRFPWRARWRRITWHWRHRRSGGVSFPPGDWWRLGTLSEQTGRTADAHDPWSEEIVRCGQCGGFFAEDEGHPAASGLVCGPCWESGVAA